MRTKTWRTADALFVLHADTGRHYDTDSVFEHQADLAGHSEPSSELRRDPGNILV
jgi:hypothetical protein